MISLLNANALHIPLADGSVQMVVTSPPYYGLRDYGISDQIGLEATPEAYVENMVAVFREVWRVLRDDGVVWLNLGDSYAANRGYQVPDNKWTDVGNSHGMKAADYGLKPKDLIGIPWRVAFALQADGWYLRSDIIWHKPNPMPESVTDRPTKSHEYLFLLSKSAHYYYDAEAVKEDSAGTWEIDSDWRKQRVFATGGAISGGTGDGTGSHNGRNRRTVWTVATAPYSGAHFATYPPALIEPCIKAGTSERGACPKCGAPWERVTETTGETNREKANRLGGFSAKNPVNQGINCKGGHGNGENRVSVTLGWQPTCDHDAEPVPCVVLDPFNGSGTTGLVARKFGRNYVGLDLSIPYLKLSQDRLSLTALEEWTNGKPAETNHADLPLFSEAA